MIPTIALLKWHQTLLIMTRTSNSGILIKRTGYLRGLSQNCLSIVYDEGESSESYERLKNMLLLYFTQYHRNDRISLRFIPKYNNSLISWFMHSTKFYHQIFPIW